MQVRFRGLKKNHDYLCAAFALVNLYMHRKRLAPLDLVCLEKRRKRALRTIIGTTEPTVSLEHTTGQIHLEGCKNSILVRFLRSPLFSLICHELSFDIASSGRIRNARFTSPSTPVALVGRTHHWFFVLDPQAPGNA